MKIRNDLGNSLNYTYFKNTKKYTIYIILYFFIRQIYLRSYR